MDSTPQNSNLPSDSNLRATAPEYFPPANNKGATRKRYTNQSRQYNNSRYKANTNSHNNFEQKSSASSDALNYSSEQKSTSRKPHFRQNGYNYEKHKFHYQNSNAAYNNHSPTPSEEYAQQSQTSWRHDSFNSRNRTNSKYGNYGKRYSMAKTGTEQNQQAIRKNSKFNQTLTDLVEGGKENKSYPSRYIKKENISGQRERLIDMIERHALECLVCCDKIKNYEKTWSCLQCHHILHLNCIITWATSSKVDDNWRCPACQNLYEKLPSAYRCYCGKSVNPKFDPNLIAHACGDVCLKKGKTCSHKCNILCHPGPCPDCSVMVSKRCGCGQTEQIVKCSSDFKFICDSPCNKLLICGVHNCLDKCHVRDCGPCKEVIIQECFCGKTGRKITCDPNNSGILNFICENPCNKQLSCSNHTCEKQCHPGPCDPCSKDITIIKYCYCGKTQLDQERKSCLDPIPCCDQICDKVLKCGHTCKSKCHDSTCPVCPLSQNVRCRCSNLHTTIACREFIEINEFLCEKKCQKKRACGKHKCNQKCCIDIDHVCQMPCNRLLSCGLHRCERTCHFGRCPPCLETSFEELYCECGASVLYPPIPCGKKPPPCNKPCSKPRPCGHPANHECHTGPCPPCFIFTNKWCYGNHEERGTIPCSQEVFSCGLACNKPMPCQNHKCIKPCHGGECPVPCTQPCLIPRLLCGHPCNKPCHEPPCPDSSCKQSVPVTCLCGLQKSSRICMDVTEEFRNLEMEQIKDKIHQSDNISTIHLNNKMSSVLKILDCNDECRLYERNRRLAIGLQIKNPDLTQKLSPRYSDFLKQWGKKDPKFCQRVHEKLSELVQLAKQSKQKSRSHSFESMNRDKRHFIHEYCEYFGVESEAYDREPNRNVVATANKDRAWLPSMSLLEVLQRENGQRKVPGPIVGYRSVSHSDNVSLNILSKVQK